MKSLYVILLCVLVTCSIIGCKQKRKVYDTVGGVELYSEPTSNLTWKVQQALLEGKEITGAYEENGEVIFIYEEEQQD